MRSASRPRRHPRREYVAVALAVTALFVALGGPAYAAKKVTQISGSTIKAKSITSKQLANGTITLALLSSGARGDLTGPRGPVGAPGAAGATGAPGAAGATGAPTDYDVYDSAGRRLGRSAGAISSLTLVLTDEGALLAYSFDTSTSGPLPVVGGTLYYTQAACAGQAYMLPPSYPGQFAGYQEGTPAAGSTIWIPAAGSAPQSISIQSARSGGSCSGAAGSVTVVPARTAGTVPAVQKPLVLKAVS